MPMDDVTTIKIERKVKDRLDEHREPKKDPKDKEEAFNSVIVRLIDKIEDLESQKEPIEEKGTWEEAIVPETGRIRLTKFAGKTIDGTQEVK